jgi:arsenite methyltransferase
MTNKLFEHPRFASGAFDELPFWSSRFGALLFDNLELRPSVRGLDVGCAAGFPLFELAHVHGPSSHFTGIDVWADALERARGKIEIYGDDNVDVREADAAAMPFDDESFDLITSNLGINNFADPAAAMRECHRVARPGARLALTTNVSGHMTDFYQLFRETLHAHGRGNVVAALNAQEAHRGTRTSVEALVIGAGFRLTKVVESEFTLRWASGGAMFRHPLVSFFLEGWHGVTDDPAIYASLEEKLNARGEVRQRVPMLYVEAVR